MTLQPWRGCTADAVSLHVARLEEASVWVRLLTPAEQARAEGMENAGVRGRFVVSRGMRRHHVARALGCAPFEVDFCELEGEKPRLAIPAGVEFNLSHSGQYVALAVGPRPVGVDIEMAREVRDIAMLVARSFQADEAAAWQRLEAADRVRGFFLLWTAREAAMKCAGLGLAKGGSITRVDPAVLREDEVGARVGAARMRVRRMEAPEGYVMALARA